MSIPVGKDRMEQEPGRNNAENVNERHQVFGEQPVSFIKKQNKDSQQTAHGTGKYDKEYDSPARVLALGQQPDLPRLHGEKSDAAHYEQGKTENIPANHNSGNPFHPQI